MTINQLLKLNSNERKRLHQNYEVYSILEIVSSIQYAAYCMLTFHIHSNSVFVALSIKVHGELQSV